jgi:SAM-dependent methyltransferase
MDTKSHWEEVYRRSGAEAVSWYSPHLDTSLKLIASAARGTSAAIIDVGGGPSTLVDDLLERGYENICVLDVSRFAIDVARERLARHADRVRWIAADITRVELEPSAYDVWHDRAVFHFLTTAEERVAYVRNAARAVKPGGHVIVSTFGPNGPHKCGGLDVIRYDAETLHDEFGARFRLVKSAEEIHRTPLGTDQQFLYCYCR